MVKQVKLGQTRKHKELQYLEVTPIETVVMHDPLKTRNQDTTCYKVIVNNQRLEYTSLYTEKYLREAFYVKRGNE